MSSENNTFKIYISSSTTDTIMVFLNWSETAPVTNMNKFNVYTFGFYGRFQVVKYGHVGAFEASCGMCTE